MADHVTDATEGWCDICGSELTPLDYADRCVTCVRPAAWPSHADPGRTAEDELREPGIHKAWCAVCIPFDPHTPSSEDCTCGAPPEPPYLGPG